MLPSGQHEMHVHPWPGPRLTRDAQPNALGCMCKRPWYVPGLTMHNPMRWAACVSNPGMCLGWHEMRVHPWPGPRLARDAQPNAVGCMRKRPWYVPGLTMHNPMRWAACVSNHGMCLGWHEMRVHPWLHDCMAGLWLHGCMTAWLHGYMAAWLHGCMAA